jgi:hypothetical protein
MRKPSVWTDEMKATAAGMKRAGFSATVIAKRLGVTPAAVSNQLRVLGARRTSPNGPRGVKPARLMSTHLIRVDDEEDV